MKHNAKAYLSACAQACIYEGYEKITSLYERMHKINKQKSKIVYENLFDKK